MSEVETITEQLRHTCDVDGCTQQAPYASVVNDGDRLFAFSYCEHHIKTYSKCKAHRDLIERLAIDKD